MKVIKMKITIKNLKNLLRQMIKIKLLIKKTDESDRTNESNDNPIEDNGTEDSIDIPLDEGDVNTGNESNQ